MLESTKTSLEHHLAYEVMAYPYLPEVWEPTKDMSQAFMCLEQMSVWSMEYNGLGSYGVDVNIDTSVMRENLIIAICLACAIETGWETPEDNV
jgi:hypothetical protein